MGPTHEKCGLFKDYARSPEGKWGVEKGAKKITQLIILAGWVPRDKWPKEELRRVRKKNGKGQDKPAGKDRCG